MFDLIILLIVLISSLLGAYRGIVSIFVNFVGFLASIIFAVFIFSYVDVLVEKYIENNIISMIVSGFLAYFISLIIFTFLCNRIVAMLGFVSKGPIDRTLGFLFGLLRGGIIAAMLYMGVAIFSTASYSRAKSADEIVSKIDKEKYPEILKESSSTRFLQNTSEILIELVPSSIFKNIDSYVRDKSSKDLIDEIKEEKEEER